MKNRYKKELIISSIVLSFIAVIFAVVIHYNYNNNNGDKNLIEYIEDSITNQSDITDNVDKINEYLEDKEENSEYYFIKGYLSYISNNNIAAIKNFKKASKNLTHNDSHFIKIYTYIFLNESLAIENETDSLVENCKISLKYISEKKAYKNDMKLIWRDISVLLNEPSNIEQSINLLNSYLDNTVGLTDETTLKLISNIGQIYSLVYKYSDAMYNYLDALHMLDVKPYIKDKDYYRIKLLTSIGDINFILKEFEVAINYYDQALEINIDDEIKNATSKILPIINKGQSYIELKKYDLASECVMELNDIIPYVEDYIKDDILILQNNILALANIYEHNFEKAEEQLLKAKNLLAEDEVEFSLNKDVFIDLTYAQLYKEKEMYDKALDLYNHVLERSINEGLGLSENIYLNMSEIYTDLGDEDNYRYYNSLYIKEKDYNTDILKSEYMNYVYSIYESNLLKAKSIKYKANLLLMFCGLVIVAIIVLSKNRNIKLLRESNFTDSMTGLNNRKYLDHYIKKNKKSLLNKSMSIFIVDIDYFKKYNDNYGHIEGDKIIKEVAYTLKSSVRKTDTVIRYGGEEMVLIFTELYPENSEVIAKKIQANLRNKNIEHKYSDISDRLTISMGIYNTIYSGEDIYSLIDNADKALYKAKKSGRNRYEILE